MAKDLKPEIEDRISKLHIPGSSREGASKRVYPNGSVAGGVVGFLKDGTTGQAGIEQTQDEILVGTQASASSRSAPTGSGFRWRRTNSPRPLMATTSS